MQVASSGPRLTDHLDTAVQSRGVRRVLLVTLGLNLAVSAGKVLVGHLSGSLAMVADGYHSLVDGSNNVIGLIVAAFAFRPPDRGHPYGHRKFETAATALIGIALLTLAWEVVSGALARAGRPALPVIGLLNWLVMAATIGVNLGVSWYENREGRRLRSAFLVADATHTRADLYVSLGVVASFAAALAGFGWADPLVALAIAAIIGWQAVRILLSAFNVLTDRAPIPPERLELLASAVPGVRLVHDVRTRGRGDAVYVDLTVHLDAGLSLREAHEVSDRIEAALQQGHPEIVDVVVHLEPEGHEADAAVETHSR
jgi:cation diffusion facilitator family transporter